MKENSITQELHMKASLLSQDAFVCIAYGRETEAIPLYEQAFELEREAAMSLLDRKDIEPTRSTLFRSAAALAKKCHRYKESEKMIAHALTGNPPEYVEEQLREIYDAIRPFLLPKKTEKQRKQKAVLSA